MQIARGKKTIILSYYPSVKAVSVSGQQHGTVYWSHGVNDRLGSLDSTKSLGIQMKGAFAFEDSPVWMDSSTSAECVEMEEFVRTG